MNTCRSLTKLLPYRNGLCSFWPITPSRNYHATSPLLGFGGFWRQKLGLPQNPNSQGPLTDLPDYTFLDGRRTPITSGKLRRYKEQEEIAERIMKLTEEVDNSVENYKNKLEQRELRRQEILNRKLKPKGDISGSPRLQDIEVK